MGVPKYRQMTHSDGMIAYAEYLLDTGCPYRDITTLTGICSTTLGQLKQRMRDGDPTLPPAWDPSLPPPRMPESGGDDDDAGPSINTAGEMIHINATELPTLAVTGIHLRDLYKVKEPAELLAVQTFAVAYNAAVLANDTLTEKKTLAEIQMAISMMAKAVSAYAQVQSIVPPPDQSKRPVLIIDRSGVRSFTSDESEEVIRAKYDPEYQQGETNPPHLKLNRSQTPAIDLHSGNLRHPAAGTVPPHHGGVSASP